MAQDTRTIDAEIERRASADESRGVYDERLVVRRLSGVFFVYRPQATGDPPCEAAPTPRFAAANAGLLSGVVPPWPPISSYSVCVPTRQSSGRLPSLPQPRGPHSSKSGSQKLSADGTGLRNAGVCMCACIGLVSGTQIDTTAASPLARNADLIVRRTQCPLRPCGACRSCGVWRVPELRRVARAGAAAV